MNPRLRLNFPLVKIKNDSYFKNKIVLGIFYRETVRIL